MDMKHKYIRKTKVLFTILQLIKYRNDDDYTYLARGLRNNPNIIEIQTGKKTFKRPICLITAGGPNDGLFACVRWMLDGLFFCKTYSFFPVIRFPDSSLYKDNLHSINDNVFDCYFDQPINYKEFMLNEYSYIKYSGRNRLLAESLNDGVNYEYKHEYVETMSEIWKEYVKFNVKIENEIFENKECLLIDDSVLGVHIRGTDFKANYKGHPKYIPTKDYIKQIDEALKNNMFKKIYLATDDKDILEEFEKHYDSNSLIYNSKIRRVSGNKGIHTSNENRYEAGIGAIIDMAILSYCGGLISGLSQLGLISRIYKNSRGDKYLYDLILNGGINKTGRVFKVENS